MSWSWPWSRKATPEAAEPRNLDGLIRWRLRYTGRVQGVGFRFTVRGLARECKVTGWVKNLDDGGVLIEAQGTPDQVSALTDAIKRESARERTWVRATLATREELVPQQEDDFRIAY